MSSLRWEKDEDPDAEYGQVTAKTPFKGTKLIAFSDRDGTEWGYQVGEGGDQEFGIDTLEQAKTEAEDAAREEGVW